ncbi:MAG: alcohol dehydrogenase catalytic domain-containing protein [Lagierella massiliensis]|nr:alcohol dehydrogenase catalytic domain-containing protein [Lagierella massiliensis]
MKALYFNGNSLEFKNNYEVPHRASNESLIKIKYAGICNTDREILKGYRPDFKGVLGHEFVGEVVETDDEGLFGKRVVGEINKGCGQCKYCLSAMENHCLDRQVLGINKHDGVFAEYISWPNRLLHIIDDDLEDEKALFTEPLAAALEILQLESIKPDTRVLLLGDGRLSYMIGQVIALTGCEINVLGKHEEKLLNFKAFANTMLDTKDTYPIVIDATGSPTGIHKALELVENRGKIVVKSTYTENVEIDLSEIVVRELKISGSRCGPFKPALNLLTKGYVNFPKIKFYDLKDYKEAFSSREFKVGFKL